MLSVPSCAGGCVEQNVSSNFLFHCYLLHLRVHVVNAAAACAGCDCTSMNALGLEKVLSNVSGDCTNLAVPADHMTHRSTIRCIIQAMPCHT